EAYGASGATFEPPIPEPAPLDVATSVLPNGQQGSAYAAQLDGTGGLPPYSWSVSGLPAFLAAGANGRISGVPVDATYAVDHAPAPTTVVVTIFDSLGTQISRVVPLTIDPLPQLKITTDSPLPNGKQDEPYLLQMTAIGGKAPYTWTWSSLTLPAGLSMTE